MRNAFRGVLVIMALAAVVPVVFHNQLEACNPRCCCKTCRQPCGRCCCTTPAAVVPQTSCQPVLQQRDVVTTEYRTEPIVETVPATVVENVIVDEGSYQTVWVPRVTTKAVARTTYQTRTSYRTVPFQVTRRVSEYGMQTVRNVPGTGNTLAYSATPIYGGSPAIAGAYPTVSGLPVYPTAVATSAGIGSSLVPDARYADAPVTPITPRSAAIGSRYSDNRTADRSSSLFVPAPSAAQVWQTPRDSYIR